jgi:leucyl-tRNA synthetase
MPYAMEEKDLPLELPETDNFKPSGTGEGPLANLKDWIDFAPGKKRDSNTKPTHAGAAWYFLRYTDPKNDKAFSDKKALDYWGQVDVYIGGSEHAVAHLLYARLWIKILHDLQYLKFDEPFRKLINQGKVTGDSRFIYRVMPFVRFSTIDNPYKGPQPRTLFISHGYYEKYISKQLSGTDLKMLIRAKFGADTLEGLNIQEVSNPVVNPYPVLVDCVNGLELDLDLYRAWKPTHFS